MFRLIIEEDQLHWVITVRKHESLSNTQNSSSKQEYLKVSQVWTNLFI